MYISIFLAITSLVHLGGTSPSQSTYKLSKTYNATNFFSEFDFMDSRDIWTKGFARYAPKEEALRLGLAKTMNNQVYLGVESTERLSNTSDGRKSVRLESKDTFDQGLLVADFARLPASTCGMWPAFFLLHSSTTPYSEIDIIENVSLQPENEISMYTNYGPCDMEPVTDAMSGAVRDASCYHNIRRRRRRRRRKRQEGEAAKGCGATAADGTFGDAFNERGGGVWALLVDEGGIKIWDFGPGEVPGDIDEGNPRPEEWEIRPVLNFRAGNCDIRKAFQNMKIKINITFCGRWAGEASWSGFTQCKEKTGYDTCEEYVARNATAFEGVYFLINSVRLFNRG